MTTRCSIAMLESALAGELPADREEWLHRHLEECDACNAALEEMTGGAIWYEEAAALLAGDELDEDLPPRGEWSDVDFTVEHLEPSDDPNVLGRLGGYDVLEIIGRGGMGVVLKGFDRELKRCVAIKALAPPLAQSSLAKKRFAREAQAAAAVVHPNVLAIHQVQPNGRLPFLVMPLVAGESLAARLAAQGRLELKETLRIGMQAAAGLAAAHEQGLVHRDVKPANILLEKGVERAVLTDFGLARAADDVSMTRWGVIAGTPQYMSPEQARGEPLDGRSDLFSLGCVLYEMAAGVSPFRADSTLATLRRLIDDPPAALGSLNPELPQWFIGIVDRLLEKDPARRFASAKEVSELLEGCLAHLQQPAGVPLPGGLPAPSARPVFSGKRGLSPSSRASRWPTLRTLLIGLGFLGAVAAAFAAGVIIVIKRDGKETRIEVPDGSNARVTDEGRLEVTLPRQTGGLIHIKKEDQEATVEPATGSSVRIGADGQINVELPEAGHAIAPVTPENAPPSAATIQQSKAQDRQRARAQERMHKDADTYSPEELQEIESMFEAGSRSAKWRTEGGRKSLKALVEKYKKADRTGCAILYLGQGGKGDEQIAYLRQAMTDYGDCFFDNGVQIGAIARLYLGMVYLQSGKPDEAKQLFDEIRKDYPDAIDGYGNLLVAELSRYESPQWIKAHQRMRKDAETYSPEELREIESLYSILYQKPYIEEKVRNALKTLVRKYPKANRTGCALLPLSLMSRGDEQIAYLKQAIADHSDSFYGDGVRVGAYARFYLGQVYLHSGKPDEAKKLFDEIRKEYPDAIDHQGRSLVAQLATVAQQVRIGEQMQKSEAASVRRQAVESTTSKPGQLPQGALPGKERFSNLTPDE